jgi:hypothetical protein
VDRQVRRLCVMRITFLPHALKRMDEYGVTEEEVRLVVGQPDNEGTANLGRRYAQKVFGHRRIRVVYNRGADEAVVVTVMLRRREGSVS